MPEQISGRAFTPQAVGRSRLSNMTEEEKQAKGVSTLCDKISPPFISYSLYYLSLIGNFGLKQKLFSIATYNKSLTSLAKDTALNTSYCNQYTIRIVPNEHLQLSFRFLLSVSFSSPKLLQMTNCLSLLF